MGVRDQEHLQRRICTELEETLEPTQFKVAPPLRGANAVRSAPLFFRKSPETPAAASGASGPAEGPQLLL